jgi:site-specific recombinase XerD
MTDLIRIADPNEIASVAADRVRGYLAHAQARNTITGYRSSFQQFATWCEGANLLALPAQAETVTLYLSSQAGRLRPATLEHHLAAISKAHKAASFPSPVTDDVLIAETLKSSATATRATRAPTSQLPQSSQPRRTMRLRRPGSQSRQTREVTEIAASAGIEASSQ